MNSVCVEDPGAAWCRDALGVALTPAGEEARIVSLVPSLTELVCDLGLSAQLVGRTGFCIHPAAVVRSVAKVGGTKDVKFDVLRALAPTHVLVNVDENRRETVDELATFVPNIVVTHPCTPADNFALFRLFGTLFGRVQAAHELCVALQMAREQAAAARAALSVEQVLYLIWREPWMTVARDTYIAAMLAEVGWQTWPAQAGQRYPEFDWSDTGEVERVLLSTEPYHFKPAHLPEVEQLGGRPASMIDGEMVSWYGSRAIAGLRYLLELRASV
ncbi:MAG: helical backbone metal receptor [Thauera sp.]|jgi:ABC-type Fe3+-hydroxamate transport system substrate-binding protein|nr:helical backbone metal receptor [Thauera sp.]